MKKMFNKMSNTVKTMTCKAHCAMTCARAHLSAPLCNTRGEGYIDTAIKILIAALAAASAVDCRKRTIPDFLCLLTAAAGLISFSPAQFFGVLAALPLLIAALIRPECMGGGDIKLTAAAGFVLGFWRGIWGMALGLLLAVLYFCTAMLFQKFIHHPLPAMTRAALPLGPFLSIGFAALYCFGG